MRSEFATKERRPKLSAVRDEYEAWRQEKEEPSALSESATSYHLPVRLKSSTDLKVKQATFWLRSVMIEALCARHESKRIQWLFQRTRNCPTRIVCVDKLSEWVFEVMGRTLKGAK